MRLSVNQVLAAVNGNLLFGNTKKEFDIVSRDSNENIKGSLFVPIKGEKYDGHIFINDAVKNGAIGYLTENDERFNCDFAIKVTNTKKALGDLARYVIAKINPTVIGITGSVGKTTTRNFVASVLAKIGKTAATIGNFNNDIGLPLSILAMDGDEKFAVLEMGMNKAGEISYLTKIAKPDIAVITLIGTSHIEYLGNQENILKAKLEILEGLKENGKIVFNGVNDILYSLKDEYSPEYYGRDISIISENEPSKFVIDNETYEIDTAGVHNIINASCGVLIGKLLGGSPDQIRAGLKDFVPEKYRQEIVYIGEKTIIKDYYNASLDSDIAALSVLKSCNGKRKVAILGAIGELGNHLEVILNKVGEAVFKSEADLLICVDENSNYIKEGALKAGMPPEKIFHFEAKEKFYKNINSILENDDTILIKASRAYKFEELYEFLKGS